MHGCLERTPEFLREGARINPYSPGFHDEIERMIRRAQVEMIKSGLHAAWRFFKRGMAASIAGLRAAIRAFVWFWNVPVLGGTDTERR
jgi:hypothetical protein